MGRLTTIYIATFAAGGALLWCVLAIGSHLRATPDVAGSWRIDSDTPEPIWIHLNQSGRFLRVTLPAREAMSLSLEASSSPSAMTFRGENQHLTLEPTTVPATYLMTFSGDYAATFHATREPPDAAAAAH